MAPLPGREVTLDKEQCLCDHYTAPVTPPPLAYTPTPPVLATMEPLDTFLMGDEVISTIPERENDEFIKSSVDDLVLIPKESDLTLDNTDLECREHLDTLSTGDREVNFNLSRDIEELEHLLVDDPVPVPRVFDEPLAFLRSSAKLNLSSSSNLLPSCALVKKNMISEFAEALFEKYTFGNVCFDEQTMAYYSSSLSEVELSSSLDSFLAFKAIDLLCSLLLSTVLESFLINSS
ncbi:hypothetical protein Tco_0636871 [Tanacetum coccineum]